MEKKIKSLKLFFFSFFILGLLVSNIIVTADSTVSDAYPAGFGLGPFQDGEHIPISNVLSAGSVIVPKTKIYGYTIEAAVANWQLTGAKWILKNPSNEAVYTVDAEIEIQQVAGLPELPWWWPFGYLIPRAYYFIVDSPEVLVPAFAASGGWKLELYLYDKLLNTWEQTHIFCTWDFSVGTSTILDNIMAPIYISWGGVPGIGGSGFSFALPCLFILTVPIWGYIAFLVLVRLWTGSFSLGGRELKKGFDIIRSKRGVRKNDKVKKSKR